MTPPGVRTVKKIFSQKRNFCQNKKRCAVGIPKAHHKENTRVVASRGSVETPSARVTTREGPVDGLGPKNTRVPKFSALPLVFSTLEPPLEDLTDRAVRAHIAEAVDPGRRSSECHRKRLRSLSRVLPNRDRERSDVVASETHHSRAFVPRVERGRKDARRIHSNLMRGHLSTFPPCGERSSVEQDSMHESITRVNLPCSSIDKVPVLC